MLQPHLEDNCADSIYGYKERQFSMAFRSAQSFMTVRFHSRVSHSSPNRPLLQGRLAFAYNFANPLMLIFGFKVYIVHALSPTPHTVQTSLYQ